MNADSRADITQLLALTHSSVDSLAKHTPLRPTNDVYGAVQLEGQAKAKAEEMVLSEQEFEGALSP